MLPEGSREGVTSVLRVARQGPQEPQSKHIVWLIGYENVELSGLDLNDIQMYSPLCQQWLGKYRFS